MARNESGNIADAISTLGFASQIIMADTGSSDDTMEVAAQAGAEVHSIFFDGYGSSKNRAIEFCKHDWIFCIDADERVSPELAQSIVSSVRNNSEFNGLSACRLTYFLGKPVKHSGWYPEYVLRLFKKGKGRFSDRLVHESVKVEGKTGKLSGILYHHSYKDLDSYLKKMDIYSAMSAEELYNSGRKSRLLDFLLHPPATFFKMYFLKAGFLDGANGLMLAGLSSFHVFVKYARLRELCTKESRR
jgi:glycosyltransferase involved in cell wall biosynthesis